MAAIVTDRSVIRLSAREIWSNSGPVCLKMVEASSAELRQKVDSTDMIEGKHLNYPSTSLCNSCKHTR